MAAPPIRDWSEESNKNRYSLLITIARNELMVTRGFVADDNPWGCTAREIANWKKYRKAWADIAQGDKSKINFTGNGDWLIAVQQPNPPPGWISILKQVGMVTPILCRVTDLDITDPTLPADPTAQAPKTSADPDNTWYHTTQYMVEGEYVNTNDYDEG